MLQANIKDIVNIFEKVESYQSHRKQNEEDLELKYRYLYTLAHKVMAEARLHRLSNPSNADGSAPKEFKLGKKVQADFMLDSDQEQNDSELRPARDPREKILQDLGLDPSKVTLEDLTIADLDDVLENLSNFSGIVSDGIEISEHELDDSLEDPLLDNDPIPAADDCQDNDFGLSCLSDFPSQNEQAPKVQEDFELASDFDFSGIQDSALAHLLGSEVPEMLDNVPATELK